MAFENNVEKRGKEPITDIETFRKNMESFWHRETSKEDVRRRLAMQESMHQSDLLRAGYDMTAYLRMGNVGPKDHPGRDLKELEIATTSGAKRGFISEAAKEEGLEIREIAQGELFAQEEEERSHALLRRLIKERKEYEAGERKEAGAFRHYTPALYALDVSQDKVTNAEAKEKDKNVPILACDVVVLKGERILEKPKSKAEAVKMLRSISGKEVEISIGATFLTPTTMGRMLLRRAGRIKIHLQNFSEKEIEAYLAANPNYLNIAGAVDYSGEAAKYLIDEMAPAEIEHIEDLHFGTSRDARSIAFSPALLEKMEDYTAGTPRELVKGIIEEGKILSK